MKHVLAPLTSGICVVVLAAGQMAAHHSEAAYDLSTVVTLKGVVTEVAMTNPHGHLSLAVTETTGNTTDWVVELPSATGLATKGIGRLTLKQGDEITLEVWVAKSGPGRATARMIHLPNGKAVSTMTPWHCGSAAQEGCAGPGQLAPAPAR